MTLDFARAPDENVGYRVGSACRSMMKMLSQPKGHTIFHNMETMSMGTAEHSWERVALSSIEQFVSEVRYGIVGGRTLSPDVQSIGSCLGLALGLRYGSSFRLLRVAEEFFQQQQQQEASSGNQNKMLIRQVNMFLQELADQEPPHGIVSFTASQHIEQFSFTMEAPKKKDEEDGGGSGGEVSGGRLKFEVTISKDPKGLGLVIGLSKKTKQNADKKQVVFIRALQPRSDGSQSAAVKNGEICPQDVVEAVNGVEVGTDLNVLTQEINKVDVNGDITFRLSRLAKAEKRRLKALADTKEEEARSGGGGSAQKK